MLPDVLRGSDQARMSMEKSIIAVPEVIVREFRGKPVVFMLCGGPNGQTVEVAIGSGHSREFAIDRALLFASRLTIAISNIKP